MKTSVRCVTLTFPTRLHIVVLRHLRGAHHADQRAVEVGRVLRALPDGLAEHELEVGGEVDGVEEHPGRRVVALGDGRLVLEAVLARGGAVDAQRALVLAAGVTEGLQNKKDKPREAEKTSDGKGGWGKGGRQLSGRTRRFQASAV